MKKIVQTWWNDEIKKHPFIYILLTIILIGSLFIRVYRVGELLQFYYDQGRDALVIWDLWHNHKPFLIGPITGLTGIFLGPFFYYLIAPVYLIGGGNPSYPAVFLSLLSVIAIYVTYYLGWKMQSRVTGLVAATIGGFSYYMMLAGRWLSNPTPILLTSVLLLLAMWKILESKSKSDSKIWWPVIALVIGLSMQFESASAIFYIPMVFIFSIWQWKKFPPIKHLLLSISLFTLTLTPQILFNFRHDNLLFDNFAKLFLQEKGFKLDFMEVLHIRMAYFWSVFSSKINPTYLWFNVLFSVFALAGLLFNRKKLIPQNVFVLFLTFLGIPMIGYILFQGNYGNMYDYYMTGYYLPMILLFSIGLTSFWNTWFGKIALLIFFFYFFQVNLQLTKNYITAGVNGPTDVRLLSERQGVNWVFTDALENCISRHPELVSPSQTRLLGSVPNSWRQIPDQVRNDENCKYNVDVYVPPVIPHTYDYLFLWLGTKECGESLCGNVKDRQLETIYILYEADPPHPERLNAFLNRYRSNTKVEEQVKFGGITVERRKRI